MKISFKSKNKLKTFFIKLREFVPTGQTINNEEGSPSGWKEITPDRLQDLQKKKKKKQWRVPERTNLWREKELILWSLPTQNIAVLNILYITVLN